MAKLKLTKNEFKKQKDNLKRFTRFLPTLMLKKQQLQMEIRNLEARAAKLQAEREQLENSFDTWKSVFAEDGVFTPEIFRISKLKTDEGNIAGVSIPIFAGVEFETAQYDLIEKPLWLDIAVGHMKGLISLDIELQCLERQQYLLGKELQMTSQRVNLFEKIKIPEAESIIKKIAVYLGDQQTAAVVRSKISKQNMGRVV